MNKVVRLVYVMMIFLSPFLTTGSRVWSMTLNSCVKDSDCPQNICSEPFAATCYFDWCKCMKNRNKF
ncbi:unnamed protein product [Lathyrus oleraceus]